MVNFIKYNAFIFHINLNKIQLHLLYGKQQMSDNRNQIWLKDVSPSEVTLITEMFLYEHNLMFEKSFEGLSISPIQN